MAKTRAQRKAEKRRRQAELERQKQSGDGQAAEGRAQQDTQLGVSGEVAEAEAAMHTGTTPEDLQAPAPSRADVGAPEETPAPEPPQPTPRPEPPQPTPPSAEPGVAEPGEEQLTSRERKRLRRAQEREQKKRRADQDRVPAGEERRRGAVLGFFASCWAELKKVQWPNRDTLVQASAVTLVFVAVMAAYLGGLDAVFNWLVKRIL